MCACLCATAIATGAIAQSPNLCDPQIRPGDGEYGYRLRGGDRCEGKFDQPTAVEVQPSPVSVISFACRVAGWTLDQKTRPEIAWQGADGSAVSIRAETPPERTLRYRLDAKGKPNATTFTWDPETINALSIKPSEIAVLVRGSPKLAGEPSPGTVILALLGTTASKKECDAPPTLALRTIQRFSKLTTCVQEYAPDSGELTGTPSCFVKTESFAPNASISFPLDSLSGKRGIYRLTLTSERPGMTADAPLFVRISTK